ncbi:uncharacterized protein EAF02_010465 [Botrytis sinoallii]|uniref:uncharacterized protein n=1 Tax=Botrytis sinoallii TaxID=1463999 RepID=UPI0019026210|nr:uncharacterized protein EAF02_010465 [Botrytis sinoallii]KAF7862916.1 hypothetical protein EAF02_010465 [Botrytis sinoallii]
MVSTRQNRQRSTPFDEQLLLSASMRMMQKTLEGFFQTDVIKYSKKGIYDLGLPRYRLLIHPSPLTRSPASPSPTGVSRALLRWIIKSNNFGLLISQV